MSARAVCNENFLTPRKEFSARTKRQAWERANGFCEGVAFYEWPPFTELSGYPVRERCNAPLMVEAGGQAPPIILPHHYDHIDPDWFSKDNELDNCQVLCHACHKLKTQRDVKNIAKSKRIINKRIKAVKPKRGFRGWRRFDGSVVRKV